MRLAQDLPVLALDHVSGHFGAKIPATGFEVTGRQVGLSTRKATILNSEPRETIRIEPMDFHLNWQPDPDDNIVIGSAGASRLDPAALAGLAEHFPFDAHTRQLLSDFAPRGLVSGLSAQWKSDAGHLQTYSLKAGFDGLALKAHGDIPGASGLSGYLRPMKKWAMQRCARRK